MPCVDPSKTPAPETISRTPNPDCPWCQRGLRHPTMAEGITQQYHPYSGHGFTKEAGWSHADLP
jgi:hypothetical protein